MELTANPNTAWTFFQRGPIFVADTSRAPLYTTTHQILKSKHPQVSLTTNNSDNNIILDFLDMPYVSSLLLTSSTSLPLHSDYLDLFSSVVDLEGGTRPPLVLHLTEGGVFGLKTCVWLLSLTTVSSEL